MGLAGKIKNSSNVPSTPLQQPPPQQHAGSSYEGASAPGHDSRYGAAPPYAYPPQPQQHGAPPSVPHFTEPQRYHGDGYPAPHGYPAQQPHLKSENPYGVQGQSTPYAAQGPLYGEHVQNVPYGAPGQSSPYAAQKPSERTQVQNPSSTYGMLPHGAGGAQPSYMQPATNMNILAQKLQAIIQANRLHPFYPQGKFQATLQKVASINFDEIAAQWKISKELAYDLAPLALYDIVFYCDDSGSMAFEENGERITDLKFILSTVSGIATKFDDDGITVRFMNSDVNGDGIRSATDVAHLISKVRFAGMTPLATNLDRKVIQPFVLGQAMSNMAKPVLTIIITDGEPSGEDPSKICQVIHQAKDALTRTQYGHGAFAVQIAQVGKDAQAQRFLESLDKHPVVGGMIDCTSYYEMEEAEFARKGVTLTPELWLLKMCVGAIDPEYDSKDA